MYTPQIHMKLKMAKMSQTIPQCVIEIIKEELIKNNIINPNVSDIRKILLACKLYDYIDLVNNIISELNNPIILVDNEECCICYENVNQVVKLICKHFFCKECLKQISDSGRIKCPLCRNEQNYIEKIIIDKQKETLHNFEKNENNYKMGKNYISFTKIIQDISDKPK
jgi:hypothetical protein